MLEKDATYAHLKRSDMLARHPNLVPSFRAILLDWLSEVSHECKFHRETYHLAVDFTDRYLTAQTGVDKLGLQLIGVTCLFIASKYEEIHPPSVAEFADLTDGACSIEDIIDMEIIVLNALNWDITPMTPNNWLNTYTQILINLDKDNEATSSVPSPKISSSLDEEIQHKNDSFLVPTNNGIFKSSHKRIACVIDLAILHLESLNFSNSVLSAAALSFFVDKITLLQCTGYGFKQVAHCAEWLKPFVETVREITEPVFVSSSNIGENSTQMHTHIANTSMLDFVMKKISHIAAARSHREQLALREKERAQQQQSLQRSARKKAKLTAAMRGKQLQLKHSQHHHHHSQQLRVCYSSLQIW